jgi:hypothetical protein
MDGGFKDETSILTDNSGEVSPHENDLHKHTPP